MLHTVWLKTQYILRVSLVIENMIFANITLMLLAAVKPLLFTLPTLQSMLHLQVLPLLLPRHLHTLHNSVMVLKFRLCQVLLADKELVCTASPTEFSTAFCPREESPKFAFGCKSNDQFQLISNITWSSIVCSICLFWNSEQPVPNNFSRF